MNCCRCRLLVRWSGKIEPASVIGIGVNPESKVSGRPRTYVVGKPNFVALSVPRMWQDPQASAVRSMMVFALAGRAAWADPGPWHDSQPMFSSAQARVWGL